jgi:hypothetical protein
MPTGMEHDDECNNERSTKEVNDTIYVPCLILDVEMELIQMDIDGHPPFPLNHHFEPVVLINHDIHPFGGECNVISYSFINYIHHVMVLCTCLQHRVNSSH